MTVIYLQRQLDFAFKWFQTWSIKINTKKPIAVFYSYKRSHLTRKYELNGIDLRWTKEAKYLVVIIDCIHNYTSHVKSS